MPELRKGRGATEPDHEEINRAEEDGVEFNAEKFLEHVDDLLARQDLSAEQREWLTGFLERWQAALRAVEIQ